MNLLAIVATERAKGNSVQASHYIAGRLDAELEMVRLTELDIKPCKACYACLFGSDCMIDDDVAMVYDEIKESDAVLVSSPTYFLDSTGSLKALLDRQFMALPRLEEFAGKDAAIITPHGLRGMEGWASSTHLALTKSFGLNVLANAEVEAALPGEILSERANLKKLDLVVQALRQGERTVFDGQCPVCMNSSFRITDGIRCTICGSKLDEDLNVLEEGNRLTREYWAEELELLRGLKEKFDRDKGEILEAIGKVEGEIGIKMPKYE